MEGFVRIEQASVARNLALTIRSLALVAFLATPALAQTSATGGSSQAPAPAAAAQAPAAGGDADELSRQATDPTASLMAFNFIGDFRTSFYGSDDQGFEFRFQPVVPFRAWKTSNILRVVVPYQTDGPGNEGLKSVTISISWSCPRSGAVSRSVR